MSFTTKHDTPVQKKWKGANTWSQMYEEQKRLKTVRLAPNPDLQKNP